MKRSLGAGILAAVLGISLHGVANAEFSGSVKLSSHYAWQGGSESDEAPALSGSMTYHFSNCYAGIWASGTGTSYPGGEIDFEGGCSGSLMDNVDYSVDLLYFWYPDSDSVEIDPSEDLIELRLKASSDLGFAKVWARLGLPMWMDDDSVPANGNDSGHTRPQVGFIVPFSDTPVSFSFTYGMDNNRRNCDDYDWWQASVDTSWQGFGMSAFYGDRGERDQFCDGTQLEDEDGIFGVSISRSF